MSSAQHHPSDLESLLQFLYLLPIGVVKMQADGTVDMLNPLASQFLLAIDPTSAHTNLFESLHSTDPSLTALLQGTPNTLALYATPKESLPAQLTVCHSSSPSRFTVSRKTF